MRRWPLTPLQKGTMSECTSRFFIINFWPKSFAAAVLELGALLGALLAGVYADRYSRGQAIVWACGESIPVHPLLFANSVLSDIFNRLLVSMFRATPQSYIYWQGSRRSRCWCVKVPFLFSPLKFRLPGLTHWSIACCLPYTWRKLALPKSVGRCWPLNNSRSCLV